MRGLIVGAALCLASFAADAKQMGPEGPWLSACYFKASEASDLAHSSMKAGLVAQYIEIKDLDAEKVVDTFNGREEQDEQVEPADLIQVQITAKRDEKADDYLAIFAASKDGCVRDTLSMPEKEFRRMVNDALGDPT